MKLRCFQAGIWWVLGTGLGALCPAAELDWGAVGYPSNTSGPVLSSSYSNVDGSGVDISFTFPTSGAPPNADPGTPSPETSALDPAPGAGPLYTPRVATDQTTDPSLFLYLEFTSGNPNEYVQIDVDFSQGVQDVSLTVYDIDFGENDFQDLVTIMGVTKDGSLVAPVTLDDSPPYNDRSVGFPGDFGTNNGNRTIYYGSRFDSDLQESTVVGLQQIEQPDAASATWDFGDQELVGLLMVYTNSIQAPNNPQGQAISLGNINFTPVVPEAETCWAAAALLLALAGVEARRHRGAVAGKRA